MTSTVPERPTLGTSTVARKWWLDINTGTSEAPVWTPVGGITNFQPTMDATSQDDSDYDSGGYKSSTITALAWGVTLTVSRKPTLDATPVYDAGQEALRLLAETMGTSNSIQIRFYEMGNGQLAADGGTGPRTEAYSGYVVVAYAPQGGAMDALDTAQITLTGQGKRNDITHPDPLTSGS